MRRLPCSRCRGGASGGKALEPLVVSSIAPVGYTYKCSGCKTTNKLTARQFQALPVISPADLADPRGDYSRFPQFAAMVLSHYMD